MISFCISLFIQVSFFAYVIFIKNGDDISVPSVFFFIVCSAFAVFCSALIGTFEEFVVEKVQMSKKKKHMRFVILSSNMFAHAEERWLNKLNECNSLSDIEEIESNLKSN